MPKKKTIIETTEQIQDDVEVLESNEKKAFRALIEKYKGINPAKYALKREALESKLNEMK
jgi:hypothetical protein